MHSEYVFLLVLAIVLGAAWLVTNRMQAPSVRFSQRVYASFGGLLALIQSIQPAIAFSAIERSMAQSTGIAMLVLAEIILGGMVIGTVTSSMLLGHRYLTDTGMTIAPLRRLTGLFIAVTILRAITVAVGLVVGRAILMNDDPSRPWVLLFLSVRIGVGILGTAIFAYMIWDCVRRRSTQSATGILYLTMVFVFIGELTAQYLLRWKGLAV